MMENMFVMKRVSIIRRTDHNGSGLLLLILIYYVALRNDLNLKMFEVLFGRHQWQRWQMLADGRCAIFYRTSLRT